MTGAARARGGWPAYRASRGGMLGLVLLAGWALLALAAPLFIAAPDLDPISARHQPLRPPSLTMPLGTDGYGRPVLTVTIWGARTSLAVGLLASVLSTSIGTLVGVTAGCLRGWLSTVLMRVTDWFLVLPTLVLAAVLATVLHPGLGMTVLAIGLSTWPATARLARAQALTVRTRPYVERARALGAGPVGVVVSHVLPNVAPLVLVQATLSVSSAILAETALAFLGLADPTAVSWGASIRLAEQVGAVSAGAWWTLLPPGLAITAVSLAFTLCGRALEGLSNPRGVTHQ